MGRDKARRTAGRVIKPAPANIVLNELDHNPERRGHRFVRYFVRYADDMVILCKSKASAEQTHVISSHTSKEKAGYTFFVDYNASVKA